MRDPPRPDKFVAARLSITDPAGAAVATVSSGTDGHFSIALTPGAYVLRPMTPASGLPRAPGPFSVTVVTDHYTVVTVRFDSGIR